MELTQVIKNRADASGALAWDDLTNMRLDAGKVIEARQKEVQNVKDMGSGRRFLGARPRPEAGKSSRQGGLT